MQQKESISQEVGDIPDKAKTLVMMFIRSSLEIVNVDPEDRECVETGAIGWTLLVLATIVAEMETADLLC